MEWNKKYIVYVFLFFSIGFGVNYIIDKRYERLMSKNTKQALAIYDDLIIMRNRGPVSFFIFKEKTDNILIDINGEYNFLQKGDTVLIKYSIEDPTVAEVIDFCYMKKHKGKSYCK